MFRRSRPSLIVPSPEHSPRLLEDFVRELAGIADSGTLQSTAINRLLELSGAPDVVLFDARLPGGAYEAACVAGGLELPDPSPRIPCRGRLAKWLRVNEEALVLSDRPDVLLYLATDERDVFTLLETAVCLPVAVGPRVNAMVLLGAGNRLWWLKPGLVPFLLACSRHVAVALERAAAEQADRERLEAAARAQRLAVAGQLAAAVAHEVRNPLTTIRSSVQHVMESSSEWSNKSALLAQVIAEVDRINRTVSGMLGLSRPQPLELSEVELKAIVEEAVAFIRPHVQHHRLNLELASDDRLFPVRVDVGQFRQVLLNVLLNACEATPPGGSISVSSSVSMGSETQGQAETSRVTITIRDTGSGITSAALARVFEPFFTTKSTGSGLGLPISLEIMRRHGGDLSLESHVGNGTSVLITMPLRVV